VCQLESLRKSSSLVTILVNSTQVQRRRYPYPQLGKLWTYMGPRNRGFHKL
jgi:hypothetical protein